MNMNIRKGFFFIAVGLFGLTLGVLCHISVVVSLLGIAAFLLGICTNHFHASDSVTPRQRLQFWKSLSRTERLCIQRCFLNELDQDEENDFAIFAGNDMIQSMFTGIFTIEFQRDFDAMEKKLAIATL